MRDKETIEIALEAAETGHLVLSTLHTTDAPQRRWSESSEYFLWRSSKPFAIASQRVSVTSFRSGCFPCKGETGVWPPSKSLKSTLRTREYLDKGEVEGKSLLDAMRDGDTEGMQHF